MAVSQFTASKLVNMLPYVEYLVAFVSSHGKPEPDVSFESLLEIKHSSSPPVAAILASAYTMMAPTVKNRIRPSTICMMACSLRSTKERETTITAYKKSEK